MTWPWAILGIIIVGVTYEVNRKVGLALFALVILAMIYTYFNAQTVSFESRPPIL